MSAAVLTPTHYRAESDAPYYSCARKMSYTTRKHAVTDLRRAKHVDANMRPYHCQHCGQWHLGHRPRTARTMDSRP